MIQLIAIGVLSSALFSSTFILNEVMSTSGGHWLWSGLLRYIFMIALLTGLIFFQKGGRQLQHLLQLFFRYWFFWTICGSIGFGTFYALLCFSADYSPGWIIAATWQFTIVASLIILKCFGRFFPKKVWLFSTIIFSGVILVNFAQLSTVSSHTLLLGAAPVLLASFCYPLGNQLIWEASSGNSRIVTLESPLISNTFNKIFLMSIGSLPLWAILYLIVQPPLPSSSQMLNTFYVALLSGIAATGLFLYGRKLANNANELAAIDATQSTQVIFALFGGIVFLGSSITSLISILGLLLILLGIGLHLKFKPVTE